MGKPSKPLQFEPMSISQILDRTFSIYRDNFVRFITIAAVIQVPVGLLMTVSTSMLQASQGSSTAFHQTWEQPFEDGPEGRERMYRDIAESVTEAETQEVDPVMMIFAGVGMMISGILSMLGQVLCRGALTKSVSECYLGNDISVGEAYRFVWPRFLTLIGAGLLVALVVWFGLILCVVPGIIFGLWFALATPAIVVERVGATAGMSRSKSLVSGNLGKVFGVGFLIILISWVVAIPCGVGGELLGRLVFSRNPVMATVANQLFSVVGQILVAPLSAAAYILVYYDLRIRKEGFDLEMLAQSMGSPEGYPNIGPGAL